MSSRVDAPRRCCLRVFLVCLLGLWVSQAFADIHGKVTLAGSPRDPDVPIRVAKSDPVCSHAGKITTENWKIAPGGGLADTVVWVQDAPPATTPLKAVVDQKGCRYEPHVSCVPKGSTITFKNSDPTLHNIHAAEYHGKDRNSDELFNIGETAGMAVDQIFNQTGIFKIRCDVHPWMNGWIVVTGSSCFAVTGPDGSFTLTGLPDGAYSAQAWHSGFDKPIIRAFTVKNGNAVIDLEFKAEQAD